jgi:phage replication-related protein YjqB (UPF0714/DUF867 family)
VASALLSIIDGPDLDDAGEQIAFDAQAFDALGLPIPSDFEAPGARRQVLIDTGDGAVMFTVASVVSDGEGPAVGMGPAALGRLLLEVPPTSPVQVNTDVLDTGELVETTVVRSHTSVAVVAPHGGFIERATDAQARRVASDARLRADVWLCQGPPGGAFRRWHITSDDLSEASFPGLGALLAIPHEHAVSFHGFGSSDGLDVIVGGLLDDAVRGHVPERLETELTAFLGRPAAVLLATSAHDPFPGLSPSNVVNRLASAGGLQIEQASSLRSTEGAAEVVADVVIDELARITSVFYGLPGHRRPAG